MGTRETFYSFSLFFFLIFLFFPSLSLSPLHVIFRVSGRDRYGDDDDGDDDGDEQYTLLPAVMVFLSITVYGDGD